ncbi:hypothetical protein C9374_005503 [Naegleria lovaniensis]|uniref:Adenylate cyclase n=1 Tax=Naegleria lovaniensis TaxID=51637 RepID=A0AA88GN82_NAELO|nr:uncharacterized protein C9374_005503 [Naegleria lovaniensis]KAG2382301.1 hypothetical protein C9374_005503 [Naegleria lovaniensis]
MGAIVSKPSHQQQPHQDSKNSSSKASTHHNDVRASSKINDKGAPNSSNNNSNMKSSSAGSETVKPIAKHSLTVDTTNLSQKQQIPLSSSVSPLTTSSDVSFNANNQAQITTTPNVEFKDEYEDKEYEMVEEYDDGENVEPAFQMDEHIAACMCPVIVVDTKTNIHSMNSFGEELFGKTVKDLDGKNVCVLLSENSAGELQKRIRDYLQLRTKSLLVEKIIYDIKEPKTPIRKIGIRITEMIKSGVPYFICYLQPEGLQKGSNFEDVLKNQNTAVQDVDSDDDGEGSVASLDKKSRPGDENPMDDGNEGEGGEVQQQSFQFHSAVTQLSTIPIVAIDCVSIVQTWNPAAEHVFGIKASEILGSSLTIIMPDEIAVNHNSYVERYVRTGIKRVVDKTRVVNGKRKTGEIFPVELKITEIKDDKDQRVFLGFARDMTAVITKTEQYKHLAEQIFPASIATRVVNGDLIHDFHENVTIMFSDIENFNQLSLEISPKNLISFLDSIFEKFDQIIQKYSLEKIKTIGDNYMLASGLPEKNDKFAENAVRGAFEMAKIVAEMNATSKFKVNIRVGLSTGEVVAGIVGKKKPAYDVWGATVNFASRMQSTSYTNHIQICTKTYQLLPIDLAQQFVPRSGVKVKGIGSCDTFISEK